MGRSQACDALQTTFSSSIILTVSHRFFEIQFVTPNYLGLWALVGPRIQRLNRAGRGGRHSGGRRKTRRDRARAPRSRWRPKMVDLGNPLCVREAERIESGGGDALEDVLQLSRGWSPRLRWSWSSPWPSACARPVRSTSPRRSSARSATSLPTRSTSLSLTPRGKDRSSKFGKNCGRPRRRHGRRTRWVRLGRSIEPAGRHTTNP